MTSLVDRAKGWVTHLASAPSHPQTWAAIKPANVLNSTNHVGTPLRAGDDYFQIRLNRMNLAKGQEWGTRYDPVALVVTEFSYSGQVAVTPFLVGPSMLQPFGQAIPEGMVFVDTAVAGPAPYRGGDIAVSVILYRLVRGSYAREFLDIVQNAAKALDFGLPISSYTQVAGVVLDGVEALTGGPGAQLPVVGRRAVFNPPYPGYFALIDAEGVDPDSLWISDDGLLYGSAAQTAAPIRDVDYVVLSIEQTQRDDVTILPFYPMWQRVIQEATKSNTVDVWTSAKTNMSALLASLYTSPDLTWPHAEKLADQWTETLVSLHGRATRLSNLGPRGERPEPTALDRVRDRTLAVLNL